MFLFFVFLFFVCHYLEDPRAVFPTLSVFNNMAHLNVLDPQATEVGRGNTDGASTSHLTPHGSLQWRGGVQEPRWWGLDFVMGHWVGASQCCSKVLHVPIGHHHRWQQWTGRCIQDRGRSKSVCRLVNRSGRQQLGVHGTMSKHWLGKGVAEKQRKASVLRRGWEDWGVKRCQPQ